MKATLHSDPDLLIFFKDFVNPFEGVNTVPFTYCKYVLLGSTVKRRHKRGLLLSEVQLHLSACSFQPVITAAGQTSRIG